MAKIINDKTVNYESNNSRVEAYTWSSIPNIKEMVDMKNLKFNIRILEPGKYSYPYHFHRHAEEMFVILEGEALLRTPDGIEKVRTGDVIYFEIGAKGAHQLKNDSDSACKYLDIRTDLGMDVCEYPDSGKVNILPECQLFETKDQVDYFHGEEDVRKIW